jgi:hypothetical protein
VQFETTFPPGGDISRTASPFHRSPEFAEEDVMLWTIAVVLALLWLLGMVSNYTLGGFVHLLLVLAIASVLIRVIQGRRAV